MTVSGVRVHAAGQKNRFQLEGSGGDKVFSGFQAGENFNDSAGALSCRDRLRRISVSAWNKEDTFPRNQLDRLPGNKNGLRGGSGLNPSGDELARTQLTVPVLDFHADKSRAGLLVDQRTKIDHLPPEFLSGFRTGDPHVISLPDPQEILRRRAQFQPETVQIADRENNRKRVLRKVFAQCDVPVDDGAVQR